MGMFSLQKPTGKSNVYAVLFGGVILAASIGTVMYMQFQWNVQVKFQDSEYLFAEHRGPDGQVREPIFTEAMLTEYDTSLQAGIVTAYERMYPPRKKFLVFTPQNEWVMGASMQELFDGSLHVKVQAFDAKSAEPVKAWEETFADQTAVAAGMDSFAEKVATDLGDLKGGSSPSGPGT